LPSNGFETRTAQPFGGLGGHGLGLANVEPAEDRAAEDKLARLTSF